MNITDNDKQHFSAIHVQCPSCGVDMPGKVQKTKQQWYYLPVIKDGKESIWGCPLYLRRPLEKPAKISPSDNPKTGHGFLIMQ